MKAVFALLALLLFVNTVSCFKCHKGDKIKDDRTTVEETCAPGVETCEKSYTASIEQSKYACGSKNDAGMKEECKEEFGVETCICNTELCNGADNSFKAGHMIMIVSAVIAYIVY